MKTLQKLIQEEVQAYGGVTAFRKQLKAEMKILPPEVRDGLLAFSTYVAVTCRLDNVVVEADALENLDRIKRTAKGLQKELENRSVPLLERVLEIYQAAIKRASKALRHDELMRITHFSTIFAGIEMLQHLTGMG